jgi:hypothetical protein
MAPSRPGIADYLNKRGAAGDGRRRLSSVLAAKAGRGDRTPYTPSFVSAQASSRNCAGVTPLRG